MGLIVFGDSAFRDRGIAGVGIPGYTGAQGYTPSEIPTAVGARYFLPSPDYDDETDQAKPDAQGNKWDGGIPVYQQRVYAAAKKYGEERGLSTSEIDAIKPRKVA